MEEEEDNVALSRSMLVPFQNPTPAHHGGGVVPTVRRQLAVVVPTTSAITAASSFSRFELPRGWYVESVPRADGIRSDRYYHEPETGKKFRSTKEVERYLTGVEYTPRSRSRSRSDRPFTLGNMSSRSRKMIVSGGMLLPLDKRGSSRRQLVVAPTVAAAMTPFNLPDGWVVEEVPRKCHGWFDKYYYEPGTGRKFRSLLSVQRYLAEVGEDAPLSQLFKSANRVKKFGLQKKFSSGKLKSSTSDIPRPPEKINWVLADPRGNTWNPFIGESMIPEPIKQRWANRFAVSINDTNSAAHLLKDKVGVKIYI
ncbi:hypothetical protein RHSIM_Rhsim13G0086700 [Rhododendron simsii]|uniref:MBD domain-containing protein n=1 Tax=Rhododendron simsii TaxID=118357 RepID=A0A834FY06_RHOSS|nr:hypothetical protein RHSIM_Rhsim13G0086700 [Rhododendron simsii]